MANPLSKLDFEQVLRSSFDPVANGLRTSDQAQLLPMGYDYLELTYVTSGNGIGEIETVTYKTGGAAGTVVATLTLTYDGSNSLSSITRS